MSPASLGMIDFLYRRIMPAAYDLLPPALQSPHADAMLLTITLQESRGMYRRQIHGPARGFQQFEVAGVQGLLRHPASKDLLRAAASKLQYPTTTTAKQLQSALEHNDVLSCVCARLLLWTLPDALPEPTEPENAWLQYLKAWRPGRPHRETWPAFYRQAWEIVLGPETTEDGRDGETKGETDG